MPNATTVRVFTFLLRRIAVLAVTVVVGVYLAILAINFGGFVDDIFRDRIQGAIMGMAMSMVNTPVEEKFRLLEEAETALTEAYGLNDPFALRTLRFLRHGLALDFGDSTLFLDSDGDKRARAVILERLPNTLLLAGSANLLLFFVTIAVALALSRRYGQLVDRLLVLLAPLSSAPSWIYGALLIAVFAVQWNLFPLGGMFDLYPPETRLGYVPIVLRHMVLPVLGIVLSTFFQGVYAWRTFFLIQSQEDYVEMAHAKGLPARTLERRYILRPALPAVLTSFGLMFVGFWQNAIALEVLFRWPGIGALFLESLTRVDRSVTIGLVVTFAYLLALTLLLLDVITVFVDPRLQVNAAPQLRGQRIFANQRRRLDLRLRMPSWTWRPPSRAQWTAAMRATAATLSQLRASPAAVFGLVLIAGLVVMSLYAVVTIPYGEAIARWRAGAGDWVRYPQYAQPAWTNLFRARDLPESLQLSSREDPTLKHIAAPTSGMTDYTFTFAFDFPYAVPPQEIGVFLRAEYAEKQPLITITWQPPGEEERELAAFVMRSAQTWYASQDQRLARRLRSDRPVDALFAAADDSQKVSSGQYILRVRGLTFEPDADIDADFVLYGQVYGWAGTDHQRRDLGVALLWGAPIALLFGLVGAVTTAFLGMLIAAAAAWFGGWVDTLVQWLTGVNLILPTLPLAMTIYFVYGKQIWLILGVIIVLSIFGGSVKQYRAFFLQARSAGYLEAAQVYGAGTGASSFTTSSRACCPPWYRNSFCSCLATSSSKPPSPSSASATSTCPPGAKCSKKRSPLAPTVAATTGCSNPCSCSCSPASPLPCSAWRWSGSSTRV
ncbi:MAG: ABC transporter permease subunit [Caldilineaceae bacterium]